MSRSYRHPVTVDGYGTKRKRFYKRLAAKRVRRYGDVPDGNSYRRCSDSWDICDFKIYWNRSVKTRKT